MIIGGHRDGWGPGAADNVSGTVSVLEAARAVAEEVKAGVRPKRTIIFATWDAEEWGLIGSTEFVEDDSLRLSRGAVAYFNQDVAAQGPRFGGGGSPSLRADAARRRARRAGSERQGKRVRRVARAASASPIPPSRRWAIPGGGSDFAGFYNHLGIPIAEWGFGGAGGVYHSQYDDYAWMTKFGDPAFCITPRRRASAPRWCCASRTRTCCRTTTSSTRGRCGGICAPIDTRVARSTVERVDDGASRRRSIGWSAKARVQRGARLGAARLRRIEATLSNARTAR